MTDVTQSMLQQTGVKTNPFPPSSRYSGIDTATMDGRNGEPLVYLRRRIVPPAEKFYVMQEHTVKEGERLDNIAAEYLGDPERFWQICDANNVLEPGTLTEEPGSTINITLPEGIPGNTYT